MQKLSIAHLITAQLIGHLVLLLILITDFLQAQGLELKGLDLGLEATQVDGGVLPVDFELLLYLGEHLLLVLQGAAFMAAFAGRGA